MKCAHLQWVTNQYTKPECKGMKIFGVTDYTTLKLGYQKVLRSDGQTDGSDPLIDLRFAKATQVKQRACYFELPQSLLRDTLVAPR